MSLSQRDVVEAYFPFPDGKNTPHPVIVLSVPEVQQHENSFIGVPISHSAIYHNDSYSFPLDNTDFDKALRYDDSSARLHLVTVISAHDLVDGRLLRKMKPQSFKRMMDELLETVFGVTP